MDIKIAVKNKTPVYTEQAIVCNNSDYTVTWDLDDEWSDYDNKTMRCVYMDGTYTDTVFSGSTCALPVVTVPGVVQIGLYAGDIRTSRMAVMRALSSALTSGGAPADPPESVYNQLMEKLNEIKTGAYDHSTLVNRDAADQHSMNAITGLDAAIQKSKPFLVSVVYVDTSTYHADKTYAEILAAYNAGKTISAEIANYPGIQYPMTLALTMHDGTVFVFSGTMIDGNGHKMMSAYVHDTDAWDVAFETMDGIVLYTEQTLTYEQKAQARANIGAIDRVKTVYYFWHTKIGSTSPESSDDDNDAYFFIKNGMFGIVIDGTVYGDPGIDIPGMSPPLLVIPGVQSMWNKGFVVADSAGDWFRGSVDLRYKTLSYLKRIPAQSVLLNSSSSGSTKKFEIIVDDNGTISATEVST